MNRLLVLSGISYSVKEGLLPLKKGKDIIKNINLEIAENSITGLAGESGCGKTTLARIIAGITPQTGGSITMAKSVNVQMLFQNSEEILHPLRKVSAVLSDVSDDKNEIESLCALLKIKDELLDRKGCTLSGGERQRTALLRILLKKPGLIVLDEPFSAQDPDSQIQLINLFKEINERCKTSLFIISHNIKPIIELTETIHIMYKGSIVESGETKQTIAKPFHPYTEFLLKAESYNVKREEIKNEEDQSGLPCSFYSNCQRKLPVCKETVKTENFEKRRVYCNNILKTN